LGDNAATDLRADGVQRECSTDYHLIVLRSFLGAMANARRFGMALPDGMIDRVERACDFALHVQRPDGRTPSLSDGDVGDFRDVLALAADLYDRADLRWAATLGRSGRAPATTSVTFPVGGYVVQRSGWGDGLRRYADEWFAVFDVGPLGDGGHGHYDHLSVELAAEGRMVAVDPGRYTYADGPWRRWFKGTAGHNTVTVDDLDQTPYRRGKPKGATSSAALVSRRTTPLVDAVVGRALSPSYDAVHTRRLALVRDRCWVVHDQLRAESVHEYALRWHLPPDALGQVSVRRHPSGVLVRTPAASFIVSGAIVKVETGWVSDTYGDKVEAPVVVARVVASDADVLTVVVPDRVVDVETAMSGPSGCFVALRGVAGGALLWPAHAAGPEWGSTPV
jgi:Heparinase II/III-like protein/Heparinase II/III N-terminus